MPLLWNSWDVVFSLTLCAGILTPLLHPGVCARRAKQTPPLAGYRSTILFMSYRRVLGCLNNIHCSSVPAVPRRSLATPLKSNKIIHLYLRLQQLLKSNWETLGILCSPWALADVRCLIPTLHCHSCKLQLMEWKHKKRNSNPEKNGCIILGKELWLAYMQTQAVSKVGSKQRKCLMRPMPAVSARGRKPWLAAHWSIVWIWLPRSWNQILSYFKNELLFQIIFQLYVWYVKSNLFE